MARHGCRVSAQSGQCVPIQTAAQLLLLLLQASDQYLLHQVGADPMNVAAIADYPLAAAVIFYAYRKADLIVRFIVPLMRKWRS